MLDRRRLGTFLIGGAVGALAGIVFAPRSGRELRGSISNRAGEARERSREAYFDAQERLQERFSERREDFHEAREAAPASEAGTPAAEPEAPRPLGGLRSIPADSEELRERIRATRNRLRGRSGGSGEGGLR